MQPGNQAWALRVGRALLAVGIFFSALGCDMAGWVRGDYLAQRFGWMGSAYTVSYEDEGLWIRSLLLSKRDYPCETLAAMEYAAQDDYSEDDETLVEQILFQMVSLDGPLLEGGDMVIANDLESLSVHTPVSMAQARVRFGTGYELVSATLGTSGTLSWDEERDGVIHGEFAFESPGGPFSGWFNAVACPALVPPDLNTLEAR